MLVLLLLLISAFAQAQKIGTYCLIKSVENGETINRFKYVEVNPNEKDDSDSDSSSDSDNDNLVCVLANEEGVFKFEKEHIDRGDGVLINTEQGHKIAVELSVSGKKGLMIDAKGALGSLTLRVPASGNVPDIVFKNVNAATLQFEKVEDGKALGGEFGIGIQTGNPALLLDYQEEPVDFTKYRRFVLPETDSYTIVINNVKNFATTEPTKTNIIVDVNKYKLPQEVLVQGDDYVIYSLDQNVISYKKVTKRTGYKFVTGSWKYQSNKVCYDGTGCVMESNGIYTFNKDNFQKTQGGWSTNTIEAEGGHTVEVTFDNAFSSNFYLKCLNANASKKVTYRLRLPNGSASYGLLFQGCKDVSDVSLMMSGKQGQTKNDVYVKVGTNDGGEEGIKYVFDYDDSELTGKTEIPFENYSNIKFEGTNNFSFDFAKQGKTILFNKKATNIYFKETYSLPEGKEEDNDGTKVYVYYEKGTVTSGAYPLVMTRTTTKRVQDDSSSSVAPSKPVIPPVKDDSSSVAPSKPVIPPVKDDSSSVAPSKPVNPPVNPPKVEDSSDDSSSSELPILGPLVKGYYHTGDFVYKYSEKIDSGRYVGKYVVETNGTYQFGKANFFPEYTNWEKLYLWAKDGHKFHFNIDIKGKEGADFEFFGENGPGPVVKNVAKKTKYSFDLPCFDLHYGLHFFQTTDTIDLNFKKCSKNHGRTLYVKNFGEGNLTLHYKVHYEIVGKFDNFDYYQGAIFQKGMDDTMEVMDLPAVTSFGNKTNIGIDGPAPIPTVPSGNGINRELVHVRFTDSSSAWYGWLYYIVYTDAEKANMKKGYWRPANTISTYSYTYSDYVYPGFEKNGGLVIQEANNRYTLTEKHMNPHRDGRPLVLIPTGKTPIEVIFDRKVEEGVDPSKVFTQAVFVRTNTPLPTKDTYIGFKFVPSNARGALTIQQEEKAFDVPIVLNFDRPTNAEDEHPTKISVKGNYAKYIERRDKEVLPTPFETIKYDVIYDNYDFNAKQSVAFTSYKKIMLEAHVVESTANVTKKGLNATVIGETIGDKVVGIKLNNIYFGGKKLPQFKEEDKIDTNIYANPNVDQQIPVEMSFQPQKYDATHNIIYTLYRENKVSETIFKIKSKLVEANNAGFNPEKDIPSGPANRPVTPAAPPAPSSASSIFIAALIMLFAFLF